jgi:hypothetical protein
MTQDALTQANSLREQISQAQQTLNRHLAVVKKYMPELAAADQATLDTAIHAIHDPGIAALQTQFSNLAGTYTAPAANTTS